MKKIKVLPILGLGLWLMALAVPEVAAMDADLWDAPWPPNSSLAYQDKPAEFNGIPARVVHLRSSLKKEQIFSFYEEVLLKGGWQIKEYYRTQDIMAFIKKDKFFYVVVREKGPNYLTDFYLLTSPSDLAICKVIAKDIEDGVLQRDAPGRDILDIPRYPASKRMLSAFTPEEGKVVLYQAEGGVKEIAQFYRQELKTMGWQLAEQFEVTPELIERFSQSKLMPQGATNIFKGAKEKKIDFYAVNLSFTKDGSQLVINIGPMPLSQSRKYSLIAINKDIEQELGF